MVMHLVSGSEVREVIHNHNLTKALRLSVDLVILALVDQVLHSSVGLVTLALMNQVLHSSVGLVALAPMRCLDSGHHERMEGGATVLDHLSMVTLVPTLDNQGISLGKIPSEDSKKMTNFRTRTSTASYYRVV
jgi:hypothetical protein